MWFDSHCHLGSGPAARALLEGAQKAGVTRLVTVGTDAESSRAALQVAAEATVTDGGVEVWAAVGLHPHDAVKGVGTVEPLVQGSQRLVAIGECGLDYHYDFSPRPVQREAFAAQVALARRHGLALVVHTREAWDDTFAILRSEGVPERTVIHCFTGGPDQARAALELGAWLSFSGIVTFKGSDDVRQAAALCPLERLLVETDSPYLAPVPFRGRPNTPAYVPFVAAGVAAAKGVDPAEVEAATWRAAAQVYGLALP
ncbi:MAG: TatD family hydrolase [Acidimicrobiales bacterium]